MVVGEEAILAADPSACILRISLPMGISFSGHAGAIDWIVSRFKKSRPATLYFDEIRTPTYTDCLNRLCNKCWPARERRLSCRRPAAAEPLSDRTDHQPRGRIRSGLSDGHSARQAGPIPPRAGNVCMDCGKLIAALGYDPFDPWPYCDALVPTHAHWHRERPPDEPRSPKHLHRVLATNPNPMRNLA